MTAGSPGRWGRPGVVVTELMALAASCERQVAVVPVRAVRRLRAVPHVVPDGAEHGAEDRDAADRPQDLLPQLDEERDVRVRRQAVPLRVISVREDRDDARAVDARRIVDRGLREAVVLELPDAGLCELEHVLLRPEVEASGRTR